MKETLIFIVAMIVTLLFVYHNEQHKDDWKYKTALAFAAIVVFEFLQWFINFMS